MNLRDLPSPELHTVLHGPPLPPRLAARRLATDHIRGRFTPEALHEYTDADGRPLFWRIRARLPNGEKWMRPMSVRGMVYALRAPEFEPGRKPLYRLHEIAAADPSLPALWVEGEGKADRLAGLGLLATTAGGANDDQGVDVEPLRGRRVIIWPDNDTPGRQHAQRVASRLRAIGCTVETIDIDALALPEKGDVVDYLAAHQNLTAADLTALPRLSEAVAVPTADWPEPAPLPADMPAVEAFELDLLPAALRPWIADIAERVQCPPDFPAVAAMIALGSVLGRKVCIRPKRHDTWFEAANLWGVIVGRPGVLKTPAINEALRPLRELEAKASADHTEALRQWQATKASREIERKAANSKALASAKQGKSFDPTALIDADDPDEPALRRYVVNDTSVEALGEVLMRNPNGTLAYRDELIGLLRQLDREGNEGARSFFLTAWTGKEPYTFDRIGRGLNRRIDAACLALLGSIQPTVIGEYLREAVAHAGGDGLMARFSLLTWPDISGDWRNIDRLPDSTAKDAAFATFRRFDALLPDKVGALREFGDVHALRFDAHAQDCFDDWRESFERAQRSGESNGTHPALIAHFEKYRKLVPALALICHLADKPNGGPIDADALVRALGWVQYAESHARRAYASVIRADAEAARELLRRIRRGEVEDGFRLRDVYRNGWARLGQADQARKAVEMLCDFDYLKAESEQTSGRWTERYRVHPKVLAEAREFSEKCSAAN
jgi:hypothetical protein